MCYLPTMMYSRPTRRIQKDIIISLKRSTCKWLKRLPPIGKHFLTMPITFNRSATSTNIDAKFFQKKSKSVYKPCNVLRRNSKVAAKLLAIKKLVKAQLLMDQESLIAVESKLFGQKSSQNGRPILTNSFPKVLFILYKAISINYKLLSTTMLRLFQSLTVRRNST